MWYNGVMAKKKTRRDTAQIARENLEHIIGEKLTGQPLDKTDNGPQKRGQAGGLKGGKARAKRLDASRRREIAKQAAKARWKH